MKEQRHHSKIYKIDGVGIDLERFSPSKDVAEKNTLRFSNGFSQDDFILIYTAEFIPRKNHQILFDILPDLKIKIPNLKVILCGKGELLEYYRTFAATNGMDYIIFTGYTKNVNLFYRISDICVSCSVQEGQGLNIIEGMATGLPVVASNIRGHCDVLKQFENGFLFDLSDRKTLIDSIMILYKNPALRSEIGERNIIEAKNYSVMTSVELMAKIYGELIDEITKSYGGGRSVVLIFPYYKKFKANLACKTIDGFIQQSSVSVSEKTETLYAA